jgi:hypothetical protein
MVSLYNWSIYNYDEFYLNILKNGRIVNLIWWSKTAWSTTGLQEGWCFRPTCIGGLQFKASLKFRVSLNINLLKCPRSKTNWANLLELIRQNNVAATKMRWRLPSSLIWFTPAYNQRLVSAYREHCLARNWTFCPSRLARMQRKKERKKFLELQTTQQFRLLPRQYKHDSVKLTMYHCFGYSGSFGSCELFSLLLWEVTSLTGIPRICL